MICVPTPLTGSREPDLTFLLEGGSGVSPQSSREGPARRPRVDHLPRHHPAERPGADPRGGPELAAGPPTSTSPFSPERIDPGDRLTRSRRTPKLGRRIIAAASSERARQLYSLICDEVVVLSTPEAAELSKLLENIFRSVNIALVNELAQLCDRLGIDVWEVVDAAATKPFGFMRFDPGPGMGGHCLPVDPFYLAFKAREHDFYPEFDREHPNTLITKEILSWPLKDTIKPTAKWTRGGVTTNPTPDP